MTYWGVGLAGMCAAAAAYQAMALAAVARQMGKRKRRAEGELPVVSILKPVRAMTERIGEAIRSQAGQRYGGKFEVLVGVRGKEDAASAEEAAGRGRYPEGRVRVVECSSVAANAKVGTLIDLARAARGSVLVVNDADIVAPEGYLEDVVGALGEAGTGVVTCLYRAEGGSFAARFEGLGVATDFAASTLVAPMMGVNEFGLGSTLGFRTADLEAIGGFEAVSEYLADDYQIGARIHGLGRRNEIARTVVATRLEAESWGAVWRHQVRWARTIRVSRGGGYAGLPVTCATVWAIGAAAAGAWWMAAGLMALRYGAAMAAGRLLESEDVGRLWWLIPARDLHGLAVWAAGLVGNEVEWGGRRLRLNRGGRIAG